MTAPVPHDPPPLERLQTAFRADRTSDDPATDLRALVFVLDAQEALPSFGRLRDWALERLAPAPGETAVDVGCGTGAVVRVLAERVGSAGRAVGVEPNAGLRQVAVERSASLARAPTFVDGNAYALPFEDASVDVLHCERVWQHLTEPERAAAEVARVLRPEGRAAVLDSDWGTMLIEPGDADVVRRVNEAFWDTAPNPFAGRRLRALLRAAGLEVDDEVGSSAYVLPEPMLAGGAMAVPALRRALAAGTVTQAEADAFLADLREASERGAAFMSVTMFAVVGRR
jgi:ubiquinone/menaquinone biosynthesis C-methylase UbiE